MAGDAVIVAGFGFRAAATAASLADAFARARSALPTGRRVQALATADDKARAPAFRALARDLDLPPRGIDPAVLVDQNTATQSAASKAARGTGSLAEAAALAAAGPGARLLGARSISGDGLATCALAEREER